MELTVPSYRDAPARPPPGPSKTFSIDFTMPVDDEEDPAPYFDELRVSHEYMLDALLPGRIAEDDADNGGDPLGSSAIHSSLTMSSSGREVGSEAFDFNDPASATPGSSTTTNPGSQSSRPLLRDPLTIKPQFNLDSAEKLLTTFRRDMLPHYPVIVLSDNHGVRSLSRDMPFVLLAILAIASSSSSLQGHNLYDAEFRKVLGLKFVAASERSLELLQGLLIYCAW